MKVLVVNAGSSSLKYQLIDVESHKVLAKGLCDRIGADGPFLKHGIDKDEIVIHCDLKTHKEAIEQVLALLVDKDRGVIKSLKEIDACGHRIIHGGEFFHGAVLINDEVKEHIDECAILAPLHNKAHLMGINGCQELMPDIPHIAVFDTAFHQTMPPMAYMYAIPYEYYEKYKIRRYGFHGTSHKYVAGRVAELTGVPLSAQKVITCHLGNGSSLAAIKNGKVIDTSMGFTPLAGLVMGSRCGNIDPSIVTFLMEKENISPRRMTDIMNKESGLLAISGVSNDVRDVEKAADAGNERARRAYDTYAYRVRQYIGQYAASMGGVDTIVFTAGIGENSSRMRSIMTEGLEFMGIKIDEEKNKQARGVEMEITGEGSKVRVFVIPTNEEYMIALDTKKIVTEGLTELEE
ncbi:acetate kinase [Methanosarcinaceae archaeon]|nr:acetate kinase [Methanosarcinaceae archaeon]